MTAEEKWKQLEEFIHRQQTWCKAQEASMMADNNVESAVRMNVRDRTYGIILDKLAELTGR